MGTCILELTGLPHVFFDLADLFLVNEKEAGHLMEARDLGGEQEVMDVLQCIVKLLSFDSAILETPEVILCILWALSLIVIRDGIQQSPILAPVSWDEAYNVWVGPNNDPGVTRRDAPPSVVSNNAGNIVSPTIEIKA